jgi:hypothetical protein
MTPRVHTSELIKRLIDEAPSDMSCGRVGIVTAA